MNVFVVVNLDAPPLVFPPEFGEPDESVMVPLFCLSEIDFGTPEALLLLFEGETGGDNARAKLEGCLRVGDLIRRD